jgi:hypothetical protein
MQLNIEPDLGIELPEDNIPLSSFKEKAEAACATAELLGIDIEPTLEDTQKAEQAVLELAKNPEKGNKKALTQSKHFNAPTYIQTKHILDSYALKVVENATQIRLLVTNKLIIESENEDAKIRLRALELLGKITDVGLFTEKSEVTVNNRSSQELVNTLKDKIRKLMYPENVQEAETVEIAGETIDVDKELGIEPSTAETNPQETYDDDTDQPA